MQPHCDTNRRLSPARIFQGRALALLLALALGGQSSSAEAQFNARGRGRSPATKSPAPPRQAASRPAKAAAAPASTAQSQGTREDELIARYRKLIVSEPGEEVPLVRLAELTRARDGDLQALLAELKAQSDASPKNVALLIARAGLLAQDGQLDAAAQLLERACTISPGRKEAWLARGHLEKKRGAASEARHAFEQALPLTTGAERTEVLRELRDLSLSLQDYDAASRHHARLVQLSPGNQYLKGELGRELLRRGQTEKALAELQRVVAASHGDLRALGPALQDLGHAELEAGQLDPAIKSLSRASELSANRPGQRQAIDEQLAEAHRRRGTLPEFTQRLGKSARSSHRLALYARLLEEQGETQAAIAAYRKALSRDAKNIDIRLRLVRLYELTGDIDGAVAEYQRLVKASPRDIQLSRRLIDMLLAQGARTAVLQEWDRAERSTRDDPEAGLILIDIAERLEEVSRAERVLNRLVQTHSTDSRFLVELGSRFYRKGDEKSARKTWEKIPLVHRDPAQGQIILGEVLIDHEALKDGLAALQKAQQLAPESIKVRRALALGLEHIASQSPPATQRVYEVEALAQFSALLKEPDNDANRAVLALARRHVIRLWRKSGRLTPELALLRNKLNATPPNLRAGRLLAEGLIAERDYDAAVVALEKILNAQKGDRPALLLLESVYAKQGRHESAIEVLARLVDADPRRARDYYERMARHANEAGDAQNALIYAERAVARSPNDPRAQAELGELYLMQGNAKKAEEAFRSALSQDDRQVHVALRLAELMARSERLDQALEWLTHVIRTASDPEVAASAARQALSISLPVGLTGEVEKTLLPLAISRPEQPIYRKLLLECLAAQMVPMLQAAEHGNAKDAQAAHTSLAALAEHATQPLLAALASGRGQEQQTAISLLAYSRSPGATQALLAFAQSSGDEEQRLRALLATGTLPQPAHSAKLAEFIDHEGHLQRGRLSLAAAWALSRAGGSAAFSTLLRCVVEGDPELQSFAALGLAGLPQTTEKNRARIVDTLLDQLEREQAGDVSQAAFLLALGTLLAESKLDKERSERITTNLAERAPPLTRRAALLSLPSLSPTARRDSALVKGLFAQQSEERQIAALAATHIEAQSKSLPLSKLPSRLQPNELSAEHQVKRALDAPRPQELDEALRHAALARLEAKLLEEAEFISETSPLSARSLLEHFGGPPASPYFTPLLLAQDEGSTVQAAQLAARRLRTSLSPQILRLAKNDNDEITNAALRLLQPSADEDSRNLLAQALQGRHAASAIEALSNDPCPESIALIESSLRQGASWSSRRRLAIALGRLRDLSDDEELQKEIHELLSQLASDTHQLVRQEALSQLAPAAARNAPTK